MTLGIMEGKVICVYINVLTVTLLCRLSLNLISVLPLGLQPVDIVSSFVYQQLRIYKV